MLGASVVVSHCFDNPEPPSLSRHCTVDSGGRGSGWALPTEQDELHETTFKQCGNFAKIADAAKKEQERIYVQYTGKTDGRTEEETQMFLPNHRSVLSVGQR